MSSGSAQSSGEKQHVVEQGECLNSIATDNGFSWKTLWELPANADLKSKRKDPNVLLPGDSVVVPALRVKEESGATEKRHRFRRKGVPAKLVIVLIRAVKPADGDKVETATCDWWDVKESVAEPVEQEPDAGVPYEAMIDSVWVAKGKSDDSGRIEIVLPPNAGSGVLVLHRGTARERAIELNLRYMDPVSSLSGVCKRLNNLGFPCPVDAGEMTPEVSEAIAAFQRSQTIPATGEADDATRTRLVEVHGG